MKRYIDFTNNEWKNNYLIGLKIVTRPWKRAGLAMAATFLFLTTLIPGPNILGLMLVPKILGRFG